MFFTVGSRRSRFPFFLAKLMFSFGFVVALHFFLNLNLYSQPFNQPNYYQQPNTNYLQKSQAFRQEIARFEITVQREGKLPLSLSQVPLVQEGDVIKVKLLD
jgi:hypothetical protein